MNRIPKEMRALYMQVEHKMGLSEKGSIAIKIHKQHCRQYDALPTYIYSIQGLFPPLNISKEVTAKNICCDYEMINNFYENVKVILLFIYYKTIMLM